MTVKFHIDIESELPKDALEITDASEIIFGDYSAVAASESFEELQQDHNTQNVILKQVIAFTSDSAANRKTSPSQAGLIAKYLGSGKVRLFKGDSQYPLPPSSSSSSSSSATYPFRRQSATLNRPYTTVCNVESNTRPCIAAIISVPTYMTPSDLILFLGKKTMENVQNVVLLSSDLKGRYMAWLKFLTPEATEHFNRTFNGKPFSSFEPEKCVTAIIDSITISYSGISPSYLNSLLKRPDLPNCVVCLERMDSSVTGLITIPCSHTFHCECLKKWTDDSCPVCRYTTLAEETDANHETSKCAVCDLSQSLWICLICGYVACGRYENAHAYKHYQETNHVFCLDLNSDRVWDYAADEFVHRLIQNKADGKLVEISSCAEARSEAQTQVKDDAKLELIAQEYTNLLTQQLDSQRTYYENLLSEMDLQAVETMQANKMKETSYKDENASLKQELKELRSTIETLNAEKSDLLKKLSSSELKLDRSNKVARKFQRMAEEEKALSDSLVMKIETFDANEKKQMLKIQDLEDQLHDLMFSLSVSSQLSNADSNQQSEIQEGSISIPKPKSKPSSTKKQK